MMRTLSFFLLLCCVVAPAQTVHIPASYAVDDGLSDSLLAIVHSLNLDSTFDVGEDGTEQISLAVIDLSGALPRIGGVHPENFIYPASVYKMYVAAEKLKSLSGSIYTLMSQRRH